jgi:hypothetical protein
MDARAPAGVHWHDCCYQVLRNRLENMEHDAGKGLQADTQRSPAGMPGGIFEDTLRSVFEDTLRSAVLHFLLSLSSPCRARRLGASLWDATGPQVGPVHLWWTIVDNSWARDFRRSVSICRVVRLDLT